mmetsp:Transcript_232/g.439  ORF Transcript_232/g.439 Transcript_232/m.439 type:complete len:385 (+) Transcript_232:1233-2387(+)
MDPAVHVTFSFKPDLCGRIKAKEHRIFGLGTTGDGLNGFGVASSRRGLHFNRKDTFRVVIRSPNGVAERLGTVLLFEELTVVEDHVIAKVSRGDLFSNGGNELLAEEVLDVFDALCVSLHEVIGMGHGAQKRAFDNCDDGFIVGEDLTQVLHFLVDASELFSQERVDVGNGNDFGTNLEGTIFFSFSLGIFDSWEASSFHIFKKRQHGDKHSGGIQGSKIERVVLLGREEIIFEVGGHAGGPSGQSTKVVEGVINAFVSTRGFATRSSPVDFEDHLILRVHAREKPRDVDINPRADNIGSRVVIRRSFDDTAPFSTLETKFVIGVAALEGSQLILEREIPKVVGHFGDHFLGGLGRSKHTCSLRNILRFGFDLSLLLLLEFALL